MSVTSPNEVSKDSLERSGANSSKVSVVSFGDCFEVEEGDRPLVVGWGVGGAAGVGRGVGGA